MEMFSLYRAWLHFGSPGLTAGGFQNGTLPTAPHHLQTPPLLNLTSSTPAPGSPDVSIQVGPSMTNFSAHKAILSAHSGYFKAALLNHTDTEPISVPNVNVDEFSYLLTFMYTGFLDLNIRNIYNILLATHILHMPAALEICRSFLLRSQNMETRTNVVKPIASRKALIPTQPIYAPNAVNFLPKSEDTPFKRIGQPETSTMPDDQLFIAKASTSKTSSEREESLNNSHNKKNIDKNKHKRRIEQQPLTKAVIDIACCDGPVRFHRVANKNYGIQPGAEKRYEVQEINRNAAMNKVMSENIRDKQSGDENQSSGEMFTCLYCNHTFKSQYCYQKHARRHLNPVSMEVKPVPPNEQRREVRLLDMNVQYYPCKTCGSKFPSYYFVHKHRKMCHAEEMADVTNRNNEIVMERPCDAGRESTNSSIDVEGVTSDQTDPST
ncbi:hypothetical protein WA026_002659 [Henosepilachna vigintioctopunctata]|uniref:Uncharacterized protein n=1 Tax=Henosepilachna vigintioctopunctata TaxID=420089 RepID=A0AAW1U1V0_9CUCU